MMSYSSNHLKFNTHNEQAVTPDMSEPYDLVFRACLLRVNARLDAKRSAHFPALLNRIDPKDENSKYKRNGEKNYNFEALLLYGYY